MNKYYVTIYLMDRVYGGEEEGGFYYTTYEPVDGCEEYNKICNNKKYAKNHAEKLEKMLKEWNFGRRDIYSVLSEGIYIVKVENFPPHYQPTERPHYE